MSAGPATPKYRYGWRRQLPDARDFHMLFSMSEVAALPAKHDRLAGLPSIWNQLQLGSCTVHGILRLFLFAAGKLHLRLDMLSRLMLYYDERALEGTVESDAGANIRDGIKSLSRDGVCLEAEWPYDIEKFREKPPANCYASAKRHIAIKYRAIQPTLGQIKAALHSGYPVVFGTPLYEQAESEQCAKSGIFPVPEPSEQMLGGHCMVFNGEWDDNAQMLGVDNSWDTTWGNNGTGQLPYWYVVNGLVSDCWVVIEVSGTKAATEIGTHGAIADAQHPSESKQAA